MPKVISLIDWVLEAELKKRYEAERKKEESKKKTEKTADKKCALI